MIDIDMINVEEILRSIIDQHRSIDFVESEFSRMLNEDTELRDSYAEWCVDMGYHVKTGYSKFIREVFESEDSIWDSLKEFEDEN